jgi:hypothetical protein
MPSSEELLLAAHAALAPVARDFVFLGGAVVPLYLTPAGRSKARATVDADCTVKVAGTLDRVTLDESLRRDARLSQDPESHIGRWIDDSSAVGRLLIDVVTHDARESPRFYEQAASQPVPHVLSGTKILTFSLPFLFATKLVAYDSRGAADPHGSKDLEDIVQLLQNSKPDLVDLVSNCQDVRDYVAEWANEFSRQRWFAGLLEGHGGRDRAFTNLEALRGS